ncbi:MAG: hypothetical protein HQM11_02675 [SAR324 cluster bacterium]|nr:hypothetical protein [SAR324 cluster bacterium]
MAVGVSQEQAEVQADTLKTILMHDAVTKPDLDLAKTELQRDIRELDAKIETTKKELDAKIETTKIELQRDIKELDAKIETTKKELDAKIETTKKELDAKIETTKIELQHDLKELELRLSAEIHLLKWMTGIMLGGVTALIIKTFFPF